MEVEGGVTMWKMYMDFGTALTEHDSQGTQADSMMRPHANGRWITPIEMRNLNERSFSKKTVTHKKTPTTVATFI